MNMQTEETSPKLPNISQEEISEEMRKTAEAYVMRNYKRKATIIAGPGFLKQLSNALDKIADGDFIKK